MVTPTPLRIVFFGTPAFAVPTLDALLASPHHIGAVVTQPDRPRGRGQHTSDAPVKARALAAGVPVLQPTRLKDPAFVAELRALHVDLGVVAAYGRILTDDVLAVPRLGLLNVHASLLPKYRGAAPVHRAVIAGETETGVTIMRVVAALDAGPMLSRRSRRIGFDETSEEVERDLARLGAELLVDTVADVVAGRSVATPQRDPEATYAPRLTKEDGAIDWTQPSLAIHNRIRGLHPWPHAFAFVNQRRIILHRSGLVDERVRDDLPAGVILEAHGERLIVATGDGALRLTEVQAEGKRPMPAREFLAGHHLAAGSRLTAGP